MRPFYFLFILVLCGGLLLSGCGKEKQEAPKKPAEVTPQQAAPAEEAQAPTGSAEKAEAAAPEETAEQAAPQEPEPKYPKEYVSPKDKAKMVLIPAGAFQMGDANGEDDEAPVHPVQLDAFYMDIYEVTNAQYRQFVKETGHPEPKCWQDPGLSGDNQPVVCVSWEDAVAYATWAGKRLPTEAEWEYAARGGLADARYPWGNEPPDAGGTFRANYFPLGGKSDGYDRTAPVGSFPPNGYGLYDMAGNVWEWCADWYYEHWYTYEKTVVNPQGPNEEYAKANGFVRVRRGGAWSRRARDLRCATRSYQEPSDQDEMTGFRCVISAKDAFPDL